MTKNSNTDTNPNFATTRYSSGELALMGISSETYLGFKVPEKQN